jgi:hypothetical protein
VLWVVAVYRLRESPGARPLRSCGMYYQIYEQVCCGMNEETEANQNGEKKEDLTMKSIPENWAPEPIEICPNPSTQSQCFRPFLTTTSHPLHNTSKTTRVSNPQTLSYFSSDHTTDRISDRQRMFSARASGLYSAPITDHRPVPDCYYSRGRTPWRLAYSSSRCVHSKRHSAHKI